MQICSHWCWDALFLSKRLRMLFRIQISRLSCLIESSLLHPVVSLITRSLACTWVVLISPQAVLESFLVKAEEYQDIFSPGSNYPWWILLGTFLSLFSSPTTLVPWVQEDPSTCSSVTHSWAALVVSGLQWRGTDSCSWFAGHRFTAACCHQASPTKLADYALGWGAANATLCEENKWIKNLQLTLKSKEGLTWSSMRAPRDHDSCICGLTWLFAPRTSAD